MNSQMLKSERSDAVGNDSIATQPLRTWLERRTLLDLAKAVGSLLRIATEGVVLYFGTMVLAGLAWGVTLLPPILEVLLVLWTMLAALRVWECEEKGGWKRGRIAQCLCLAFIDLWPLAATAVILFACGLRVSGE